MDQRVRPNTADTPAEDASGDLALLQVQAVCGRPAPEEGLQCAGCCIGAPLGELLQTKAEVLRGEPARKCYIRPT